MFESLTAFIPQLEEESFGKWIVDRTQRGTIKSPTQWPYVDYAKTVIAFENAFLKFCDVHPEFENTRYAETLKEHGIDWDTPSMTGADVSQMEAKGVIALLTGAFRAEHFCDGALLNFLENGSILRWLKRLQEIDTRNSANPARGAAFQKSVQRWFQMHYGRAFELEKKLAIGAPAKLHKFDLVDENDTVAIECKRYTWTETGNVPSAKMIACNEAVFFLSFLPACYETFLVMLRSEHPHREETLAEHYFRMNRHLLGRTKVAEYDPETDELRVIDQ